MAEKQDFLIQKYKTLVADACKLVPMAPDLGQNRNTLLSLIQRVLVLFSKVHEKANVLSYSTELHREGRSGRKEELRKQCLAFHMMPVKLSSLKQAQAAREGHVPPLSTSLPPPYFLGSFSKSHLGPQESKGWIWAKNV